MTLQMQCNHMMQQALEDMRISGTRRMAFREKKIRQVGGKEKIIGIKKVCAWCGKLLENLPDQTAMPISHGICLSCAEGFLLKSGIDTRLILRD